MSFFQRHPWWAVIPLILIAMALGSPRLDSEGLWYDEMWSVYVAGGPHFDGPLSPQGILQRVLWQDSTQGYGYPLMLGGWGAVAGWSEYSIRVIAMFGGLLAIAMTYRVGHDVFLWSRRRRAAHPSNSPGGWRARPEHVGCLAAMILSVSAFFVWYLHEGRVYAIVVFLGLVVMWSYLRLWTVRKASIALMALFVFSAASLLYTNYFAVVLLIGMGGYHILINPFTSALQPPASLTAKSTIRAMWWRLVFLGTCAVILCLPTLYGILGGVTMVSGWNAERSRALSLPELGRVLAHFAGHEAFLLLAVLLIVGFVWGWRQRGSLRALLLMLLLALGATFLIQWRLQLIDFTKVRYVIVLWGLIAVWIAVGLMGVGEFVGQWLATQTPRRHAARPAWLIVAVIALIWFLGGLNANLDPFFMTDKGSPGDIPRWRTIINQVQPNVLPQDVYAHYSGPRARDDDMSFWFTMKDLPIPSFITISAFDAANEEWVWSQVERAWRVWYSQDVRQPITDDHTKFIARLSEMGYVPCLTPYEDSVMQIDLYVDSAVFCPGGEPLVRFGEGVTLTGWQEPPAAVMPQDTLIVPMGWTIAPTVKADAYSIGLYLMPNESTVAAQADTGLPDAAFGAARVEIPLTDVKPGDYGLYMAIYEWNGPNALPAANLRTGETSPRLIRMGTITVRGG